MAEGFTAGRYGREAVARDGGMAGSGCVGLPLQPPAGGSAFLRMVRYLRGLSSISAITRGTAAAMLATASS